MAKVNILVKNIDEFLSELQVEMDLLKHEICQCKLKHERIELC